jgi:hypothetical protein
LVLQQQDDECPDVAVAGPVRDLEGQVGLAAAPVLQGELAFQQTGAVAVEAAGEVGDGLLQHRPQVLGMQQGLAQDAVGQVAQRRLVGDRHARTSGRHSTGDVTERKRLRRPAHRG